MAVRITVGAGLESVRTLLKARENMEQVYEAIEHERYYLNWLEDTNLWTIITTHPDWYKIGREGLQWRGLQWPKSKRDSVTPPLLRVALAKIQELSSGSVLTEYAIDIEEVEWIALDMGHVRKEFERRVKEKQEPLDDFNSELDNELISQRAIEHRLNAAIALIRKELYPSLQNAYENYLRCFTETATVLRDRTVKVKQKYRREEFIEQVRLDSDAFGFSNSWNLPHPTLKAVSSDDKYWRLDKDVKSIEFAD